MGYIGIAGHCLHNPHSGLHFTISRISPSALLSPSIYRHLRPHQPRITEARRLPAFPRDEVHEWEQLVFVHPPPWLVPALLPVPVPVPVPVVDVTRGTRCLDR
ncbi:hypothetical protein N7501_008133 [Penicillium viridicatum]|nr:hypothetical protein N7501_008133 [Penicillium viridicatum]